MADGECSYRRACGALSYEPEAWRSDVMGHHRTRQVVAIRRVWAILLIDMGYSYPETARIMGRPSHSAIHAMVNQPEPEEEPCAS